MVGGRVWLYGLGKLDLLKGEDLSHALAVADVPLARRIVNAALTAGTSPGRLYVEFVRPALNGLRMDDETDQARAVAGACSAIVADLTAALPRTQHIGPGRAALLSCSREGVGRVDADITTAFLEAGGWAVQRPPGSDSALALGPAVRADSVELAVAVVAGPQDALRLAPACTALSRLADPPVVLLCDFTGRSDWPSASVALGADALISDPQELMSQAVGRLPAYGTRRWGVGIARHDDALVLSPTGRLDGTSAGRLAEVIQSRVGTFARLIIDLRDTAEISNAGVEQILGWRKSGPLRDVDVLIVGDTGVRSR